MQDELTGRNNRVIVDSFDYQIQRPFCANKKDFIISVSYLLFCLFLTLLVLFINLEVHR